VHDALGHLATTVYDTEGNVVNTIDERGNTATFTYDVLNRLSTSRNALNW
jgi:YD repeat-containing protein